MVTTLLKTKMWVLWLVDIGSQIFQIVLIHISRFKIVVKSKEVQWIQLGLATFHNYAGTHYKNRQHCYLNLIYDCSGKGFFLYSSRRLHTFYQHCRGHRIISHHRWPQEVLKYHVRLPHTYILTDESQTIDRP